MGSSIQIALFVIPVIQLLAWCISKPLTLMFDRMCPLLDIGRIQLTSSIRVDRPILYGPDCQSDSSRWSIQVRLPPSCLGRWSWPGSWMEGLVLMMLYLIIAVSFWYYPVCLSSLISPPLKIPLYPPWTQGWSWQVGIKYSYFTWMWWTCVIMFFASCAVLRCAVLRIGSDIRRRMLDKT